MGVWTRPAVRGTPQAEDLKARAGSGSPRPQFSLTPFIRCQQGAKCAELARGGRPEWAGEGRRQRAKACSEQETRKQDAADTPRLCRGSPCPCPCLCPWGNANDYADSAASLAEGNLVPPRPAVAIGSAQSAVPSAASSRSPSPPFPQLGFSSTGRWTSARHLAALEALGSVLSGRGRGPDPGVGATRRQVDQLNSRGCGRAARHTHVDPQMCGPARALGLQLLGMPSRGVVLRRPQCVISSRCPRLRNVSGMFWRLLRLSGWDFGIPSMEKGRKHVLSSGSRQKALYVEQE
ncbi:uncharacterized protein LOC130684479 [Manis pentadactyla]|uniref:uncharacterized protein LOC130684479 n=1 Tax=Manis pentadactyla TaxID=143292 RepID=UPI00255C5F0B|nr:uncharacterized protein LOC130684479 [Manis pentadactyla]